MRPGTTARRFRSCKADAADVRCSVATRVVSGPTEEPALEEQESAVLVQLRARRLVAPVLHLPNVAGTPCACQRVGLFNVEPGLVPGQRGLRRLQTAR
jgi:hypothetical protein